jgi:hypothetical protein
VPSRLHPATETPEHTDRRAEPQIECNTQAQLLRYPSGRHQHPIDVAVVDVWSTGIGVIYSESLLIGQMFVVREPTITRGKTCLYRVILSEKVEPGKFRIALEATEQPADEWAVFEPPPAPGLDLGTKLLYLTFAIAGAATIIAAAILMHHRKH